MDQTAPSPPVPAADPAFEAQVQDVDLSLIRAMLELTCDERLQQLEDHAAFVQELRDANPALRLP